MLAASSLLGQASAPGAAARPRYGGSVRVVIPDLPSSLDPASPNGWRARNILPLVFECLTQFDSQARLRPQLATRWQPDSESRRWQFWLRAGVKFHDGTPLTAESVAASLRNAHPVWTVVPSGNSVVIDSGGPQPTLPMQLALQQSAIVRRAQNQLSGTGPFAVAGWQPGTRLELHAYDDYWDGRAFLDSLSITSGAGQRVLAVDLGKAEVAEIGPEEVSRAASPERRVVESSPNELLALVFSHAPQSSDELRIRERLATSIDRASIVKVLLRNHGEIAWSALPNWMTGYAFLFAPDMTPVAQATALPVPEAKMVLSYEGGGPGSQLIAERVALNAREARILVEPSASMGNADLRLVRIPLPSPEPQLALATLAQAVGISLAPANSPDELYSREKELLASGRIIPLAHVPQIQVVAAGVNGWHPDQLGAYPLADVWLGSRAP